MELTSSSPSKKSFFQSPEKVLTLIMFGGIFAALGWWVFPFLTIIVANTIYLGLSLAGLALLSIFLLNKRLWSSVFYLSNIFSKKILGIVLQMDPFVIAEQNILQMEKQQEIFYDQSKDVDKQKELLNKKITERMTKIEFLANRALTAKNNNMPQEMGLAIRQKERLETGMQKLIPLRDGLAKMGNDLTTIHKNIGYMIQEKKFDLEENKDLYNSLTAGGKALSTAIKIFKGDPDEKLNLELSMEALNDDMASKLASMKKDYSTITDFTKSIDLDNATYETAGLKKLENLETNRIQLNELKDRSKEKVLVNNYIPGKVSRTDSSKLLDD